MSADIIQFPKIKATPKPANDLDVAAARAAGAAAGLIEYAEQLVADKTMRQVGAIADLFTGDD